jgi:hypothetical protein
MGRHSKGGARGHEPPGDGTAPGRAEPPYPGPPPHGLPRHGPHHQAPYPGAEYPEPSHYEPPHNEPSPYPPPRREPLRYAPSERGNSKPRKKLPTLPLPLLPIVALILAVGVVSYALSTQQISLNFAGGAPHESTREGQVSQRDPEDRRPDGMVVAFRVTSETAEGFRFTATISNRGERPVPKWTMAFRIPGARILGVSGASVVRTGELGWVRSSPGAPALQPGDSVKVAFVADGTPRAPTTCKMNKLPCQRV